MKLIWKICVLLICLLACQSPNSKVELNVKQVTSDSTYYVLKKTGQGKIDSLFYLYGKLHGCLRSVDSNNRTIIHPCFEHGVRTGTESAYYFNNQLKYSGKVEKGEKVGEWKYYFRNGQLSSYECYDPDGDLKYIRQFDSLGNIVSSKGEGFIYLSRIILNDTLAIDDTLKYNAFFAKPPNSRVLVKTGEYAKDQGGNILLKQFEDVKGLVYDTQIFTDTGWRDLIVDWIIIDTNENISEHGTEYFSYYITSSNPDSTGVPPKR